MQAVRVSTRAASMEPPTNVSGCLSDCTDPSLTRFNGAAHERERMPCVVGLLAAERGFNGAAHERERMRCEVWRCA